MEYYRNQFQMFDIVQDLQLLISRYKYRYILVIKKQ